MKISMISLISEDGSRASLGRIMLWLFTVFCMYFWFTKADPNNNPPDTLFYAWSMLLMYNFGKKPVNMAKTYLGGKNSKLDTLIDKIDKGIK